MHQSKGRFKEMGGAYYTMSTSRTNVDESAVVLYIHVIWQDPQKITIKLKSSREK